MTAPVLAAVTLYPAGAQPPARGSSDPVARMEGRLRWEGVGSCAASACHGDKITSPNPLKCAVTKWTKDDPHGRSLLTLRSERSRNMLVSYKQKGTVADARPDQDPFCLKCHAMQVETERQGTKFDPTEGVGCESCHGPSGNWKAMHDLPSWKALSPAEKASHGFRDLRNASTRVAACANCHLGNADHEVNHDLIAAGHPPLFLDIAGQMSRLPYHWDPLIDRARPDFAARLWVLGQASSARASLELLQARAHDTAKPWPEFSEYDCLACHRSIVVDPPKPPAGTLIGQPPYLAWNQATTELLATQGKHLDPEIPKLLAQLRTEMAKPRPNREEVDKKAGAAVARLNEYIARLEGSSFSADELRPLLKSIVEQGKTREFRWYEGYQAALTLSALNDAIGDQDPAYPKARLDVSLKTLRDLYPKPSADAWLKHVDPKGENTKKANELLKSLGDQLR